MTENEIREKLRALPRTKNTDPRYPIDAYEDDLVALIQKIDARARIEELQVLGHHFIIGHRIRGISGKDHQSRIEALKPKAQWETN